MSVEILLLGVLSGMTLLAYMIAINASGFVRLILSYFIATIMLVGSVGAIVHHVNRDIDAIELEKMRRLEADKRLAEERALSTEEKLRENKERMVLVAKLNTILNQGSGYAGTLINADLQDRSADLETLMGRASEVKKKADALKTEVEQIKTDDEFFKDPLSLVKEGTQLLGEAAYYYRYYYYSEDSEQESLRERLLRQRARSASDRFQKATNLISSQ